MDSALLQIQKNLDSIKRMQDDLEYWSARDLMTVLGYKSWQKFELSIQRAQAACVNSGQSVHYHFIGADKMIQTGKGAQRKIQDILLTRFACYLIAQNGDPRKAQIALSQTYFATQTRKQELLQLREDENKRLESRSKLRETEQKIESTLYDHGVKLSVEFGTFKDKHIRALYGGISTKQLKVRRGIPDKRALADFDTDVELRAKDFALAITDHNIKQKNLVGSFQLNQEVVKNSKATRQTLLSRGIKPEELTPQEDVRKIEARRAKELEAAIQNKLLK